MSDYPMLISNKLHSFRNFDMQKYEKRLSLQPFERIYSPRGYKKL